jgi:hypothetical protein
MTRAADNQRLTKGIGLMQPHRTIAKITRGLAILCLACWLLPSAVIAKPTTADQAQRLVQHWLARDGKPLGAVLGQAVSTVQAFPDEPKRTDYYVVYLAPGGFVIVPADDLVEPIIAFVADGRYNPSPDNPLGALVSRDVPQRVARARNMTAQARTQGVPFRPQGAQKQAWEKWQSLASATAISSPITAGLLSISDPRVDPLVDSRWSQTTVDDSPTGLACYNYYTPPNSAGSASNYPCGCPATAMAQLMRYFSFPIGPVGTPSFSIKVDGVERQESLRGGDGAGGAYLWGNMALVPYSCTPDIQRQAIGALTHDVGAAINTAYTDEGSEANTDDIAKALVNTFQYTNAIVSEVPNDSTIPLASLIPMINPNLDASLPVLLGVDKTGAKSGHVVVADGYGYNISTLYHHLNMGWRGLWDAWYNLPIIDITPPENYNLVSECVYNVYTSGTGEIISGRVATADKSPLSGATVSATRSGGGTCSTSTNARGIYALPQLPSASTYTMRVTRSGYNFASRVVKTGTSTNGSTTTGNVWEVDFVGKPPVTSMIYQLLIMD